jgi:hypothetical protein
LLRQRTKLFAHLARDDWAVWINEENILLTQRFKLLIDLEFLATCHQDEAFLAEFTASLAKLAASLADRSGPLLSRWHPLPSRPRRSSL